MIAAVTHGLKKSTSHFVNAIKVMFMSWQFYLSFFFVLLGKSVFLVYFQPGFEIDSWNYIECVLSFDYPPLYPYFLYVTRSFSSNIYFTCMAQVLIFSFGVAVFSFYFFKRKWQLLAFVVLAGIDPASGYYVCTLLSEALFIPILLISFVFLHHVGRAKEHKVFYLIMLGSTLGLLYLVRFAGIFFLCSAICVLVFQKQSVTNRIVTALVIFISFQFTLLPVRYKYYVNFDTFQFNGFSGHMLWNNTSVLYPKSKVKDMPRNAFEKYLVQFPDSYFDQDLAIHGRQLWEDTLPLRHYHRMENLTYGAIPAYDRLVFKTALRLLAEQPLAYLTSYVVPNVKKMAKEDNFIYAKGYEEKINAVYHVLIYPKRVWHKYLAACLFVLVILSGIFSRFRKVKTPGINVLLFSSCFYGLCLPFFSVLDTRLYLVLSLPIIAALLIRWQGRLENE